MDLNLMDKMRLLGLDTELRPAIKMRPMSRYYFVLQINPSEQFFVFVSIAAWLIRKTGRKFEMPHEEDDPNSILASINEVLEQIGKPVDTSAQKVKQGSGEQVMQILNVLADEVLKVTMFQWEKPDVSALNDEEETVEDLDQVEDETEIKLDEAEEDMDIYSEESDGERFDTAYENSDAKKKSGNVDLESWRLEVERVAPLLKLKISADGRDWRARHALMENYRNELVDRYKSTGGQLARLRGSLASTMDKVVARERVLNEQFQPLVREYGALMHELNRLDADYKEASVGITERQEILAELNAKVDSVKQKTESRGTSMNDNSPLVLAKKAVSNLKKDIQEMDFQIVVLLWLLTSNNGIQGSGNFEAMSQAQIF